MLIIALKRASARQIDFKISIVSIGNIIVGGSGKTPLTINLAKRYENVAIILRGYGRKSKGLFVISKEGKILENVDVSGDEAMLLSKALPNATVIVSEDRKKGILKAKELGCKIVFLDDGFSKYDINKFDILIRPKIEPTNNFCIPSGGYREPKMAYSFANLELKEGVDFARVVSFVRDNEVLNVLPENLLLLTAISRPKRLLDFLPENTEIEAFEDHHNFTQEELEEIKHRFKDYTIITTTKDYVKLKKFDIQNVILMDLKLEFLVAKKLEEINTYINLFK